MARSLLALSPVPALASVRYPCDAAPAARPRATVLCARRRRGEALVVRAGPPSTNTLALAFVLPLSLIIGTVLVSIQIADRLDEQYLEELAINQAIIEEREAEEEYDDDEEENDEDENEDREEEVEEESVLMEEQVAAVPRARNRPRRSV